MKVKENTHFQQQEIYATDLLVDKLHVLLLNQGAAVFHGHNEENVHFGMGTDCRIVVSNLTEENDVPKKQKDGKSELIQLIKTFWNREITSLGKSGHVNGKSWPLLKFLKDSS